MKRAGSFGEGCRPATIARGDQEWCRIPTEATDKAATGCLFAAAKTADVISVPSNMLEDLGDTGSSPEYLTTTSWSLMETDAQQKENRIVAALPSAAGENRVAVLGGAKGLVVARHGQVLHAARGMRVAMLGTYDTLPAAGSSTPMAGVGGGGSGTPSNPCMISCYADLQAGLNGKASAISCVGMGDILGRPVSKKTIDGRSTTVDLVAGGGLGKEGAAYFQARVRTLAAAYSTEGMETLEALALWGAWQVKHQRVLIEAINKQRGLAGMRDLVIISVEGEQFMHHPGATLQHQMIVIKEPSIDFTSSVYDNISALALPPGSGAPYQGVVKARWENSGTDDQRAAARLAQSLAGRKGGKMSVQAGYGFGGWRGPAATVHAMGGHASVAAGNGYGCGKDASHSGKLSVATGHGFNGPLGVCASDAVAKTAVFKKAVDDGVDYKSLCSFVKATGVAEGIKQEDIRFSADCVAVAIGADADLSKDQVRILSARVQDILAYPKKTRVGPDANVHTYFHQVQTGVRGESQAIYALGPAPPGFEVEVKFQMDEAHMQEVIDGLPETFSTGQIIRFIRDQWGVDKQAFRVNKAMEKLTVPLKVQWKGNGVQRMWTRKAASYPGSGGEGPLPCGPGLGGGGGHGGSGSLPSFPPTDRTGGGGMGEEEELASSDYEWVSVRGEQQQEELASSEYAQGDAGQRHVDNSDASDFECE